MKVKRHMLYLDRGTERSRAERSHTGKCKCGRWEESCSTIAKVRMEYRCHLDTVSAIGKAKGKLDENN